MNGKIINAISPIIYFCILFATSQVFGADKKYPNLKLDAIYLDSVLNSAIHNSIDLLYYKAAVMRSELYFKNAQYYEVAKLTNKCLGEFEILKDTCSTEGFKEIHTDLLFWYGYSLAYMGYYDKAIRQFYDISKLYGENEVSYYYSKACRGLGATYGMYGKDAKAEEYFRRHLEISKQLNDYGGMSGSLSNLSILQLKKNQPDSALVYLFEANKIVVQHPEQCDRDRILYLIGSTYISSGQFELGNKYLQEAINVAKNEGNYYLVLFIENFMIHSKLKAGYDVKRDLYEHYKEAKQHNLRSLEVNALNILSDLYGKEGNFQKAYYYQELSRSIGDSLFNKESEERIAVLNADFENYKIEQARKTLLKDIQLAQISVERRNLWIIILLLMIFLSGGFLFLFIRRFFIQRRLTKILNERLAGFHKQEEHRSDLIRSRLEDELDSKNKKLMSSLLVQINMKETITDIQKKLQIVKNSFVSAGKNSILISEVENMLNSLSANEDLAAFQLYFEQVNHSFFENLEKLYPDLTQNDKRLCVFIGLNLTTKEIASLINRTVRGVETAKFRLKKKMKLSHDENLYDFIIRLKNQQVGA